MYIPDLWSLITGVASILGLLFTLPEKYRDWRKYTIPATCSFAFFAIGRTSCELSQSINALFQDPYLVVMLIVICLMLALSTMLIISMQRRNYFNLAFWVFWIVILVAIPQTFTTYSEINPAIPTEDYLELALLKEQKGEFGSAIIYYQKYIQKVDDLNFEQQLDKKISMLKSKQINELVNQK